jgi:hypothetical protein
MLVGKPATSAENAHTANATYAATRDIGQKIAAATQMTAGVRSPNPKRNTAVVARHPNGAEARMTATAEPTVETAAQQTGESDMTGTTTVTMTARTDATTAATNDATTVESAAERKARTDTTTAQINAKTSNRGELTTKTGNAPHKGTHLSKIGGTIQQTQALRQADTYPSSRRPQPRQHHHHHPTAHG